MKKPPNGSIRRAFTLIELLVVIIILAILVALLMPGAGSWMDRANSAKCLLQLRDLAAASASWSAENDGRLLPSYSWTEGGWSDILKNYADGGKYVRCPTYVKLYHPEKMTSWGPDGYPASGYGRNLFFGGSSGVAGSPSMAGDGRISQISQPSRTVAFYDNNNMFGGDAFGGYNVDGSGPWFYILYAAHKGGFNVVFFDGHAEWIKFNPEGPFQGKGAGDYTDVIWKPY